MKTRVSPSSRVIVRTCRSRPCKIDLKSPRAPLAKIACSVVLIACWSLASAANAADGAEAKKIFNQRCTACHTFGRGVKVGPDLKGVTERRPRRWLLSFIRGSQRMIQAGDPVAAGLFRQFKQERMPDWSDLTPEQVSGILDWFAVSGPEQREPDEKDAELATAAEVAGGRELFHGVVPRASGGLACAACHAIRDQGRSSAAGLAPDLTLAYLAYRDRALTLFLKSSCSLREPERSQSGYLTPKESFLIKAYLRHTALAARPSLATVRQPGTGARP
jgi:mono/diheme cytochrome c family protein